MKNNFFHSSKTVFTILSIVLSIFAIGIFSPIVFADHGSDFREESIDVGSNILTFRDSTSVLLQTHTLSVDSSSSFSGFITVNLEEPDANLDQGGVEIRLASATSTTSGSVEASIELTETGVNTGIFSGTLFLSTGITTTGNTVQISDVDEISVFYEPEPQSVSRFTAEYSGLVSPPTPLEIGENWVEDADGKPVYEAVEFANTSPFDLLTFPVEIRGGEDPGTTITVTISTANAWPDWQIPYDPGQLVIVYRSSPTGAFFSLGGTFDGDDILPKSRPTYGIGTVTNVIQPEDSGSATLLKSGQYAIAVDTGGALGGGGGGLVRPGLVVNALAGVGVLSGFFSSGGAAGVNFGGGGGGGPSAPTIFGSSLSSGSDTTFTQLGLEGSTDGIISIQDLDDSTEPITIQTNDPINLTFDLYENGGIYNVEHITMYFFPGDATGLGHSEIVSNSDTYILFDRGQSTHVIDPHGYFANAEFDLSQIDAWNLEINYAITFAKPMDVTSLLIRTWDLDRNTGDKLLVNALEVVETSFLEVPSDITSQESSITPTELVDIPPWVKNNAYWWSNHEIENSDFIAGIQYMVNQNIIYIPKTEVSDSPISEIPDWVRDVAGFWANGSISDPEFVQSIQWMITNGLMVIV